VAIVAKWGTGEKEETGKPSSDESGKRSSDETGKLSSDLELAGADIRRGDIAVISEVEVDKNVCVVEGACTGIVDAAKNGGELRPVQPVATAGAPIAFGSRAALATAVAAAKPLMTPIAVPPPTPALC